MSNSPEPALSRIVQGKHKKAAVPEKRVRRGRELIKEVRA